MLPDRKEAESFLRESEEIHPGPWQITAERPQSVRRKSHETAVDLIRKKHTSSAYSMISEEGLKREPILNIS